MLLKNGQTAAVYSSQSVNIYVDICCHTKVENDVYNTVYPNICALTGCVFQALYLPALLSLVDAAKL